MKSLFENFEKRIWTVTDLNTDIKQKLEADYSQIYIEGEISGISRPNSGHLYFSLKDEKSALGCVIYRGDALRLSYELKDGMKIVAQGVLSAYPPRGIYQLMIRQVQIKGIGQQEIALRQLKEKLLAKGYFDPKRKKKIPPYPRTIVLITSATGAAVIDLLTILLDRWPRLTVIIAGVRVQGETAAVEIATMVARINRYRAERMIDPDLIIIGRGGGSSEDLSPFNTELVAEAIYQSKIPVISAVGHEVDITIADLVADCRAATPTDAANLAVPSLADLYQTLEHYRSQFARALQKKMDFLRQRLDDWADRLTPEKLLLSVKSHKKQLSQIQSRFDKTIQRKLDHLKFQLSNVADRLESLSPLNILSRGYSLTFIEKTNELCRSIHSCQQGDLLKIYLNDGIVNSKVVDVYEKNNN